MLPRLFITQVKLKDNKTIAHLPGSPQVRKPTCATQRCSSMRVVLVNIAGECVKKAKWIEHLALCVLAKLART